jgi:hypothetical protein
MVVVKVIEKDVHLFNRSIKYIILLMLNIIILLSVYYNSNGDEEGGLFDTQFVISLLEERDELQVAIIDLELEQAKVLEKMAETEELLDLAEREISVRDRQFQRCEVARTDAIQMVNEQALKLDRPVAGAAVANCNEQNAKLRFARQELAAAKADLIQLKAQNQSLTQAIADEPQQNSELLMQELESLKAENEQLKSDIENPIYLKSVYVAGRKCDQPKFEELVCLTEVLVRPMFSKAPVTDVTVAVYDANDRKVSQASFTAKRAQLFRLPLGRGKEVAAGDFRATFEVEGQILASKGHTIAH